MSIQAVAWALEQDMPARPKLVLVSIANHANHVDGYCWLKVETIAAEASCSPRAVFNFIAALIRNGYLRKAPRKGEDGRQRANDYWILLARPPSEWVGKTEHDDGDGGEAEAQDVVEPHAPGAVGEPAAKPEDEASEIPAGACGPTAPACTPIEAEPSKTKPEEAPAGGYVPRTYRPPPPPPPQPVGSVAGAKGEMIFVFEGTPAYDAWAKVKAQQNRTAKWHATTTKVVDGQSRRGWYFPSLFPPSVKAESGAGPPKEDVATERARHELGQTG